MMMLSQHKHILRSKMGLRVMKWAVVRFLLVQLARAAAFFLWLLLGDL
jgi:hypothetical protein